MISLQKNSGFTLIELSIVLVIIGLIIGGVLVGRDLIRGSEIRATIAQFEKFNAAVHAFKLKHNALPGDISPTEAANFGLFQITGTCTTCTFNNGVIDSSSGGNAPTEQYTVWRHLSQANLIDGSYGSNLSATTGMATGTDALPMPKFGGTNGIEVYKAYRYLNSASPTFYNWTDFSIAAISPITLQALDSKVDDGMPNTGTMVDIAGIEIGGRWATGTTPSNNRCTYDGSFAYSTNVKYNLSASLGGNNDRCYMFFKSTF